MNFILYSNLVIGSLLIATALILKTQNIQSSILFKVLPFFAGLVLIYNGLTILFPI